MEVLNLTVNKKYSKEIQNKKPTINNLLISWYNNQNYKILFQAFKADWLNCKVYPRVWINDSRNTPNFRAYSVTIRWIWWYFGINKRLKDI